MKMTERQLTEYMCELLEDWIATNQIMVETLAIDDYIYEYVTTWIADQEIFD
jgi:hypothetical protein